MLINLLKKKRNKFKKMGKIFIKDLGEHIPGTKSRIALNNIKEFVIVPYFIDWYKSKESNKIFPIFMQEISDLNKVLWQSKKTWKFDYFIKYFTFTFIQIIKWPL